MKKVDWFIPFHGKDKETLTMSINSVKKIFPILEKFM